MPGEAVRVKVGVGLRRRLLVRVGVVVGDGETRAVGERDAEGPVREGLQVCVGGVTLGVGVRIREPEKVVLGDSEMDGERDPGEGVEVRRPVRVGLWDGGEALGDRE